MIHIAICNNNMNTATYLYQYLKAKNRQTQNVQFDIALYHSIADLMHDISLGDTFHIVFLDTEMSGRAVPKQCKSLVRSNTETIPT